MLTLAGSRPVALGRTCHHIQVADGVVGRRLQLSTRSEEFRQRWAAHHVKLHRTGVKRFRHPVVGDLTLDFEALDLPGDPGQRMLVYSAEPGSPSDDGLQLLASWASTPHERGQGREPDGAQAEAADHQGPQ